MSMQKQFEAAIEKELAAILKRNDEMELALAMNKQSVITVADLLTRMGGEASVPEGYERVEQESDLKDTLIATASTASLENNVPSPNDRKVLVATNVAGGGLWNQLSTNSGLLERTVALLLTQYLSFAIPVFSLLDSECLRHGPVNIRPEMDVIYEELKDLHKPMDREMDLHLTVMEWHAGVPFIDVLQKRPSGFYCFSDEKDYSNKDITLSVKSLNAMVVLTYHPTIVDRVSLEIYADVTQDDINDNFIDDMLLGFQLTLETMARYALESPESRKSRLHTYHACSLS